MCYNVILYKTPCKLIVLHPNVFSVKQYKTNVYTHVA